MFQIPYAWKIQAPTCCKFQSSEKSRLQNDANARSNHLGHKTGKKWEKKREKTSPKNCSPKGCSTNSIPWIRCQHVLQLFETCAHTHTEYILFLLTRPTIQGWSHRPAHNKDILQPFFHRIARVVQASDKVWQSRTCFRKNRCALGKCVSQKSCL